MRKALLTLLILFSFELYSQEIIEMNIDGFKFQLSKDCDESHCKITEIKVFKNGLFIQKIIPSENNFSSFIKNELIIEIEDMNFDNYIDFRIIKSIPAEYSFPYLYWIYNHETELFESNTDYEIIISPEFDYEKKLIISSWREYLPKFYKDYYKLENGIPILTKRYITEPDRKGINQIETWKTIDGKLKFVSKKSE
ncbi:XAC2610-related protein [Hanstruepera flava]|uniref:XAC2610-related protein n=1 Tax=Hanstruepera flava TaxID=2930218 RepID=UPI002028DA09|nr:nitrite reductase [Hanstruepera flava]